MQQLEQKQILPMAKCTDEQQKLPQLSNKVMKKQSTRFICIIYPGMHNGTLLLTYESRTEQLDRKQILGQTTIVTLRIVLL